jgi:hypothetical protein
VTVKKAKIQIEVEATTEGAVRGMDRVASATEKSRKAVEKNDAALKKARLEYQVAQARAENLAASQAKVTARTNEAAAAFARAGKAVASTNPALASGSSGWAGIAAGAGKAAGAFGLVAAAGIGAASMASDLAAESLQVQGVFANLPYPLAAARKETRGLADDMTLARLSIMANQSGVAKSAQSFGELAGMAQTLAFKMGRDVNDTIERVTMGIAKQEREILDELVILPRMEEMWKQYAATLGKTTGELTDHEKTAAFTKSALDALRSATQGVEVDMTGAAASIARATVEVKNLKTAALGGVEAEVSLSKGLKTLDVELLRQIKDMRTYHTDAWEVTEALEAAGVNTAKYRDNAKALETDIRAVSQAEAKRLVKLAEQHSLTQDQVAEVERLRVLQVELSANDEEYLRRDLERLGVAKAASDAATLAATEASEQRKQRILEIEEQLAFGQAAKIDQQQLNALVAEEAELRALVLESEGKGAEAAEIRRKAQLEALAALGESSRPKGGGSRRKGDNGEAARREAFEQQKKTAAELDGLFEAMFKRRQDIAAEYDPFSERNLERQLANVIDFEDKRAAVELSTRLREIEVMRANGMDPVAAAQAEADAQIKALAVLEEVSDRRFAREIQLAEMQGRDHDAAMLRAEQEAAALDFKDQAEAQYHSVAMERLAERQRMEAEVHDRRMGFAQESMDLALGAAQAIVQGAVIEGRALRSVVAATAKSEAMRHGLVLGPSALVGAGFQFAWGNIPQGTALLQSAGQSFAFAASMAAIGGAVGAFGGGGGRGKSVGGFGAEAFGPGAAANGPMESSSATGGSWDIGGSVPLSKETQQRASASAQIGSAWSSGGGAPITNNFYVTGAIDDLTAQKMTQAQSRANARQGKLTAGRRG